MPVLKLTEKNYDEIVSDKEKTILVDFWAEWCGACKMMMPMVEKLAERYPDIIIGKVNVDEESSLVSRFNIMSIPTVLVYKNGEINYHQVGYRTVEQLEDLIY